MTGRMPVLPIQIQEINHRDTENTEKKNQNGFLRELCDSVVKGEVD